MQTTFNRRRFLDQSVCVTGLVYLGYHSGGALTRIVNLPNEQLNSTALDTVNRGASDIKEVASTKTIASEDVDQKVLDKAANTYSTAWKCRDWHVTLQSEEVFISVVVVGFPDHLHAPLPVMAVHLNEHVYAKHPLTSAVYKLPVLG